MHHPSRPPSRPDGSCAVTTTQGSEGGRQPPACAAGGGSAQASRSDSCGSSAAAAEPDRTKPISSGVFQTRTRTFPLPRRASSGYFSSEGDSQPSPPLSPRPLTVDRATQTPSPSGQVMQHALQRMTEARGGGPGTHQQHGHSPSPSSTRPQNAAGDMQTVAIGRELRRIGDDYNRLLLLRGAAGGRIVIHPNPLPHIHQEPAMLLCVGILLLLIGRIIYSQGSTDSHDNSQV